jgi:hypothetical protein
MGQRSAQSYRTLAQAAGVSELDIHPLMNHSLPGVNAGYITRDRLVRDHLRKQQERISAVVIEKASQDDRCKWTMSAKVDTTDAARLKEATRSEIEVLGPTAAVYAPQLPNVSLSHGHHSRRG